MPPAAVAPPRPARPPARRTLLVLAVPALSFSLAQTMLVPAFGELVTALRSDVATVTWVLTGYLVAAAVFTPLVGRLGDMFGKRRMVVLSLLAFAAGNVVSALGHDVGVVIAGRVVAGLAGGLFPLCFGIIRDELPPERVGASVGLVSAMIGVGGGAGLLLGGVLVDGFGYASIFWLSAALALVSVVATLLLVPESPVRVPARVDVLGAVLLGLALVLVLVSVSEGRSWGWGSARTLGAGAGGLVLFGVWVAVERRLAEPMVDVRSLGRPVLLVSNLATLLVGFGMFGAYVLVPQLVEAPRSTGYGFGAGATHAGLLMLPGSLAMLVLGPLSGTLGSRFGHQYALASGGALAAAGLAALSAFHGSDLAVLGWYTLLSCGIAFGFAAMPNLILSAVPPTQSGQATAFNAVVRSVGSSLGTQVTAVVVVSSAATGSLVPRDSGYRSAFLLCGVVTAASAGLALLVPRQPRTGHVQVGDEIGAGSPLPDPAFAADPA